MVTAEVMDDTIKKIQHNKGLRFGAFFMLSPSVQHHSTEESLTRHSNREAYFIYFPKNSRVRCQASFAAASL